MANQFTLNGVVTEVDVDPDMPLLYYLRDTLEMTGTKFGCGMALCGACTVHFNGVPVRSCSLPVEAAAGNQVTTIEGTSGKVADAVRTAWRERDVVQCGYCQSGQVMTAAALLAENPTPTEQDVDTAMAGNICRCGCYPRIKAAVLTAAERLASAEDASGAIAEGKVLS